MSQEYDETIRLSREEWVAMEPHLTALLEGARDEALVTALNGVYLELVEYREARDRFVEVLNTTCSVVVRNDLMQFVTMAQRKASERALERGTGLLEGGYAEWEKLDEKGNFWSWCYQGCDDVQKEEVAKSLGQRLQFGDGSTWQSRYVIGNVSAPVLLESLFEEIFLQSVHHSSVDEIETYLAGQPKLRKAILKSQRRVFFLDMLTTAHGAPQRIPLLREGLPLSGSSSVGDVPLRDNGQSVGNSTAPAHNQEDNISNKSSKRPNLGECRDSSRASSPSLSQSEHQEDETQQIARVATPHPIKAVNVERVPRPKPCKQVVNWLRRLSRQFRISLIHSMPCSKKMGKKTTIEPLEFELEDCRKHSSQSKSTGFRGGAGLNLRKRGKAGSPAALSATTKDSLHDAAEPAATSGLDMVNELPHSTLDSTAPLQSRTNKSSPHSILEQAALSQSSSPKDSPHSSPQTIIRLKSTKMQDYVDGGDREF